MKKIFLPVSIACLMGVLSSCNNDSGSKSTSGSSFNLDSAKAAITASNKEFGASFATGDSAKFVSLYTSDGCINPPNMPRMCGSKEINAFFVGGLKEGIKDIKLTIDEVMGSEAAVAEIGRYEVIMDKNQSVDKGKYIVVWKMVDGKWKMHRDVWNSDNPCPPPPPAQK